LLDILSTFYLFCYANSFVFIVLHVVSLISETFLNQNYFHTFNIIVLYSWKKGSKEIYQMMTTIQYGLLDTSL